MAIPIYEISATLKLLGGCVGGICSKGLCNPIRKKEIEGKEITEK